MSPTADVMAIVLFLFFAVGAVVGVLIVVAWSARRADQATRGSRRPAPPAANRGYFGDEPGDEPDDDPGDEPPWWQTRDGD